MTRKRFTKLIMSRRVDRNQANWLSNMVKSWGYTYRDWIISFWAYPDELKVHHIY